VGPLAGVSATWLAVGWWACAFAAMAGAKWWRLAEKAAGHGAVVAGWVALEDAALFGAALSGCVLVAGRAKWVDRGLALIAWGAALGSAVNAAVLLELGEQVHWQLLLYARDQAADLPRLLRASLSIERILGAPGVIAAITVAPVAAWLGVGRVMGTPRSLPRTVVVGLAVVVVGISIFTPHPPGAASANLQVRALGQTWPLRIYRSARYALAPTTFRGIERTPLLAASPNKLAEHRPGASPMHTRNAVVIVLESTRWDHTSLAPDAKAATPHLARLARRGTVIDSTRALIPHTTKALFAIFCGRLPTVHAGALEVSKAIDPQCLPAALSARGYATAFVQSADGTFEQRPRLVAKLGFSRFDAREDVGRKRLGYLASDDARVHEPFVAFLRDTPATKPFFAAVLTSATHHPYALPAAITTLPFAATLTTPRARYRALVERQDAVIGNVVEALRADGRLASTVIVVIGDHGEGFGDRGVRQHDNNFYEEGLRVPFVVAGPGVARRVVRANASVADVVPTIAPLLGHRVAPGALDEAVAADLLDPGFRSDSPRAFACFSPWRCRGFVVGNTKVVDSPELGAAWRFDLATDPLERVALPLTPDLAQQLAAVAKRVDAHRVRRWDSPGAEVQHLTPWRCKEGRARCVHPHASRRRDRYRPADTHDVDLPRPASDAYDWLAGKRPLRIAHRLGGADKDTENSPGALAASWQEGYRLLEVDLQLTTDGHLVCIHAEYPRRPLTVADYRSGVPPGRRCTLDTLITFARAHPRARFVLDVKNRFARSYARIINAVRVAGVGRQFIPQVYRFPQVAQVRHADVFAGAIFTAYRSRLSVAEIVASARRHGVRAVTLNPNRLNAFSGELPGDLVTFAHPIDTIEIARRRLGQGIDGIYTHTFAPSEPLPR